VTCRWARRTSGHRKSATCTGGQGTQEIRKLLTSRRGVDEGRKSARAGETMRNPESIRRGDHPDQSTCPRSTRSKPTPNTEFFTPIEGDENVTTAGQGFELGTAHSARTHAGQVGRGAGAMVKRHAAVRTGRAFGGWCMRTDSRSAISWLESWWRIQGQRAGNQDGRRESRRWPKSPWESWRSCARRKAG